MPAGPPAESLVRLRRIVSEQGGIALDERRDETLAGSVEALRERLGLPDADAVGATCERQPSPGGPLDALLESLRPGETHFFRTRPHFDALERLVLPDILAQRGPGGALRLWSAGCSTGEEAWSLAISLGRALGARGESPRSRRDVILATDASATALSLARTAEHGEYSFRGATATERSAYFEAAGSRWRIREPWRSMVVFARHDLVREPPPALADGADVILCRNVLMHLTPEAVSRVLASLVSCLRPGGWLFVGPAEHGLVRGVPLETVALPDALAHRRVAPAATAEATPGTGAAAQPVGAVAASHAAQRDDAALLEDARVALERGETHHAARLAADVAERSPGSADASALLGRIAADAGHAAEAEAWLRRAVALAPEDAASSCRLAVLVRQRGDLVSARAIAERALAASPGSVLALQLAARLRHETGDAPGAEAALARALDLLGAMPPDSAAPFGRELPARHAVSALRVMLASWRARDGGGPKR